MREHLPAWGRRGEWGTRAEVKEGGVAGSRDLVPGWS